MATLPEKFARAQGAFGEILRRFNLLRDVVRPWTDVEGKGGIKVTVAEANVVIDAQELARRLGEQVVGTSVHPFRVELLDAGTPSAKINAASRLYSDLSTSATITDLATAITLTSTTKVWLKGTVTALELTGASITTTNPSGPITTASGAQTEFHVLIGKVVSGTQATPGFDFEISGTPYHFEQTLTTHLLVKLVCNSGAPALYPFAYAGQ
jgi:hypothetical protein